MDSAAKIRPFLLIFSSVAVVSSLWGFVAGGLVPAVAAMFLWLIAFFAVKYFKQLMWPQYVALSALAVFVVTGSWMYGNTYRDAVLYTWLSNVEISVTPTPEVLEAGAILVEGETGTLDVSEVPGGPAYAAYSYVSADVREGEAYLGDALAKASYQVLVTTAGSYHLWIKVNDDGLHDDGARSATVRVNGNQILKYNHVSKVIDGWEWFDLGAVSLVLGENSIVFEKDESTTAAFVMSSFKLVPN